MAMAIVRDNVIWLKHLRDDPVLVDHLSALRGGELVTLIVNGIPGKWGKMGDGKDGRPTAGVRPLGAAKDYWNTLFSERRGEDVSIQLGKPSEHVGGEGGSSPHPRPSGLAEQATVYGRIEYADPARRVAAIQALRDSWAHGPRHPTDPTIVLTRDDMHDRELDRLP
ncbi:MAG: hypothetical protein IT548_04030 [Alphaproteobacteria bacterium]|nr:hypothetical protein [Alphaproteobacteria bacterium]